MISLLIFAGLAARAQTLDIYKPKSKIPAPLVIFVHGGAWVGGSKTPYAFVGRAFADAGLCAAVIDYHLAPEFKHPRPVDDLETARRALGREKGCDAARTAMVGHSAGAHALAFWATAHADKITAFVGLEGIYDLPKIAAKFPEYRDWFLTAAFGPAAKWADASPTRRTLRNRAPWLVVHARADELVDPPQANEFVAHLKHEKIKVDAYDPGELTHSDVVDRLRDPAAPVTKRVFAFIKDHAK